MEYKKVCNLAEQIYVEPAKAQNLNLEQAHQNVEHVVVPDSKQ